MKIVFFGTSEFGAIILGKLIQAKQAPVLVVTTPDKPAGRKQTLSPSPVKVLAQKYSLGIFQPEKFHEDARYKMQGTKPDLFIVAAYGKILPKKILDIPQFGALNVHPSLLPKYRGPSPVQTTILNGDKETGATVIVMDEKVDHGPILAQRELEISKPTYAELHNKLAELGADLLMRTIPHFVLKSHDRGFLVQNAQDDSKATYTKIFKKEDGKIDWSKPAEYIERQVRALNPWPGTFAMFKSKNDNTKMKNAGQNLKILKASVLTHKDTQEPGEVFLTQDGKLAIQTGDNALAVEQLQLQGGKPMSAKEFLLGHRNFIGTKLC